MNDNNKPSSKLSDLALERVMRDVLSDFWEISPQRAQRALTESTPPADPATRKSEENR